MKQTKNHYNILGIALGAEDVVIRASYKALSQKYHPDKFGGASNIANEKMVELNEAYSILSDPIKRKEYDLSFAHEPAESSYAASGFEDTDSGVNGFDDPLYDEAVASVLKSRRASISAVQRHLRIGYNRAARLIEQMERAGLVSPMQSNGNREVLVPPSKQPSQPEEQGTPRKPSSAPSKKRGGGGWGFLYLVWVVFYLIIANKFLAKPETAMQMNSSANNTNGVAMSGTAPDSHTISPESTAAPDSTKVAQPDENSAIEHATRIFSQGGGHAQEAIDILKPLADKGNPMAQYKLALVYFGGIVSTQGTSLGESYLNMAAKNGHADAIFDLATRLESGNGVVKDLRTAKAWFLELQKMGDQRAVVAIDKINDSLSRQEVVSPTGPTSTVAIEHGAVQEPPGPAVANAMPENTAEGSTASSAPTFRAKFKGAFGNVVERRSYPTDEMRQKALDLWERERKILEPDGTVSEKHVPGKQNACPIVGASC